MSKQGYVYVLTNAAMPGLVKIGHSVNGGRARARDLFQTGVPEPFKVCFEILTNDCALLEMRAHRKLDKYRVNSQREFFKINVPTAVTGIMEVYLNDYDVELIPGERAFNLNYLEDAAAAIGMDVFAFCTLAERLTQDEIKKLENRRDKQFENVAELRPVEKTANK